MADEQKIEPQASHALDAGAKLTADGLLQVADGLKSLSRTCGGDLPLLISLLVYPVIEQLVVRGVFSATVADRVRQAAQQLGESLHSVRPDLPHMFVPMTPLEVLTEEEVADLDEESKYPALTLLRTYALQLADLAQKDLDQDVAASEKELFRLMNRIDRQVGRWFDTLRSLDAEFADPEFPEFPGKAGPGEVAVAPLSVCQDDFEPPTEQAL